MKKCILTAGLMGFIINGFSQNTDIMLPPKMVREQIIHQKAFSLSYNSAYVLPSWVSYKVTKSQVNKEEKVKAKYKANPEVNTRSASTKDYKQGGYIMAQLVNYMDIKSIDGAVEESFYMTNIAPMKLAFYNHIWLKTEDLIRMWVANTDCYYIVCGPVLVDAPFPTIGENNLSVAKRYYKVIYDKKNQKAIGFIFKNGTSSGTLKSYSKSIDVIEAEVGIDFFQELDDDLEAKIEKEADYNFWNFELEEDL